MSTLSSVVQAGGDSSKDTTKQAFLAAGIVFLTLIILVGLRLLCSAAIEISVLDGSDRVKRQVSEFCRQIFPCWHRRTSPEEPAEPDLELQQHRLQFYNDHKELLEKILPSRVFTTEDAERFKQKHTTSTNQPQQQQRNEESKQQPQRNEEAKQQQQRNEEAKQQQQILDKNLDVEQNDNTNIEHPHHDSHVALCSICLQELTEGSFILEAKQCRHIFHADCIREWVGRPTPNNNNNNNNNNTLHNRQSHSNNNNHSNHWSFNININNDCPNCRSPLVQNLDAIIECIRKKELDARRAHHP